jgi:(2Fe-2S) ferredoxin
MRPVRLSPKLHVFVCANQRPADSPLGPGCGNHGDAVFLRMKDEVARRKAFATIWVTKTSCLGVCPKHGATVAIYPARTAALFEEVEVDDAVALLDRAAALAGVSA